MSVQVVDYEASFPRQHALLAIAGLSKFFLHDRAKRSNRDIIRVDTQYCVVAHVAVQHDFVITKRILFS